jgi:mannose-6-phosphate isomerase-like protein (cupin superfamily)
MELLKGFPNRMKEVLENTDYLRVLQTDETMQITAMNIPHGGEIPKETHHGITQMLLIVAGQATVVSSDPKVSGYAFTGDAVWVPPNTDHWVISGNSRSTKLPDGTYGEAMYTSHGPPLKLLSVYAPPEHPPDRLIKEYPGRYLPVVDEGHHRHSKEGDKLCVKMWL